MEQDGGEVDYGGDWDFLVAPWAPLHPLHACMHVYARVPFMCIWVHDLVLLQQDSWISHPSRAENSGGITESVTHLVPNFSGCCAVGLKLCSIQLNQGCSGHLDNQKPVRVGFWKKGVYNREYGNAFRRIGKSKKGPVKQQFWGGIRSVSFSQCSAVTWDSVIDCGGACWQWIVSACSHLLDWANARIRLFGA